VKEHGNVLRISVCPRCGQTFTEPPALSRLDNTTRICPDCGTREALESIGVDTAEQEKIIETIHRTVRHGHH
jgi:DNA-directed RNA polymerase subunit RPC12/RpoP